jgi:hypothetical protein
MNTRIPDLPATDTPAPTGQARWSRRRLARAGLIAVIGLGAGAGLLHAAAGASAPVAAATGRATGPLPTAATGRAPTDPTPEVNGCLGGQPGIDATGKYVDLDQIVLAAQKTAPLTPTGAAEFTATLARWYGAMPRAASWSSTVPALLAPKTASLSHLLLTPGGTWDSGRLDFSTGGFYVESFDPTHAVVSWVANGYGTTNGKDVPPVVFGDGFHLVAINGVWKLTDIAPVHSSVEELRRIATPYEGGC